MYNVCGYAEIFPKKLGQISHVKHVFKEDLRITIINALVFSKLYYCSSVWSNVRKLQSVQNFAARIVSKIIAKKYDYVPR